MSFFGRKFVRFFSYFRFLRCFTNHYSPTHSCSSPAALLQHSCSSPAAFLQHSCSSPAAVLQHSCSVPVFSIKMSCEIVFLHNFYQIFVFSVVLQTTPHHTPSIASTSRPSDTILCCDQLHGHDLKNVETFVFQFVADWRSSILPLSPQVAETLTD